MSLESTDMPESEALRKIDDVIDLLGSEERWCKHARHLADGRRCLVAALQEAHAEQPLWRAVLRAARENTGQRYVGLAAFNDDARTTHGQLLSVLRNTRQKIALGEWRLEQPEPRGWQRWQNLLAPVVPRFA
ncbi:MAG TPA: hypothetical protein VN668_16365 [Stellaceae bacterium]|nr:hypothetical protein [Stellaceae bacterium]